MILYKQNTKILRHYQIFRDDKKGYIAKTEPKILQKLGIDSHTWLETVKK